MIIHVQMLTAEQVETIREKDVRFITSRSGGKGGQNVNKVESKVELIFSIGGSQALRESQKKILLQSHSSKLKAGEIRILSQTSRSQIENKEKALLKLKNLLEELLKLKKKRIATQPKKSAKENTLKQKKHLKVKKQLRRKYKHEE